MNLLTWKLCTLFVVIVQLHSTLCDTDSSMYSPHPYDVTKLVHGIVFRIHEYAKLQSLADSTLNDKDFDSLVESNPRIIFQDIFHLSNSSNKCWWDLFYTFESLKNKSNPWALQMLDAFGKPSSGILRGNLKWLGDYSECRNVYAPSKADAYNIGDFHGQYCSLQWTLQFPNISLSATSGICIPSSCNSSELADDFDEIFNIAGLIPFVNKTLSAFNVTSFVCSPATKHFTTSAIAVICLLSFFVLLALIGSSITAYEYFSKNTNTSRRNTSGSINDNMQVYDHSADDDPLTDFADSKNIVSAILEKSKPFFKCFCVFTNGSKLLNTDSTEGQLLSVHGIRFLSMTWVILGHTYAFSFNAIGNLLDVLSVIDTFAFQVVLQGFYSVDSFFVLSGFLLTYLFFQECAKKDGKVNWLYFYIHRYIRLTPVYMLVLGFSSTVYFYLGSGPLWPVGVSDDLCKDSWWWNLLYINNFEKSGKMCMAWSWYLANDMQFYVISPLILISLWRWPKIGFSLLATLLLGTWTASFVITYHYELVPGISNVAAAHPENIQDFMNKFADYFEKLYIKPYTRIGPYLIGILLGYLLFKAKTNKQRKLNWIELGCGWAAATSISLTCVYGLYHKNPSLVATSFYNALNRTCFAAGLSWVIFVCLTDQGGHVNSILSYKLFIPLSRLTYCAYLIHPLIITGYFACLKAPFAVSDPTMVMYYLGFIVVTYALALPVALAFESPVIALEKLVRSKFSKS